MSSPRTISELLAWRAAETPDALVCSSPPQLTWSTLFTQVKQLAQALRAAGFQPGDTAAIMGPTSVEWAIIDQAILWAGGVSVGVYSTLTPQQVAYQLKDSCARWLFIGSATEEATAQSIQSDCPALAHIVPWHADAKENANNLAQWTERGANDTTPPLPPPNDPEAVALIIYTSGTTGNPKGAQITHANCLAQANAYGQVLPLRHDQDRTISFLPMAHAIERIIGFYGRIASGIRTRFAKSLNPVDVLEAIAEERPTVFGTVPRIFEKAYEKIHAQVATASPTKQRLFGWLKSVALRTSDTQVQGQSLSGLLKLEHAVAERLMFRKLRARFGGALSMAHCGGAPLDRETQRFFHGAGLLLLEGYGMTECAGMATINRDDDFRMGSVGKPLPGIQIKIAEDGEILIGGPSLFKGYLNLPEETAAAMTPDGWLQSGDIGRLDDDGFLYITDRKKNIIVTAAGKNVAPAGIEQPLSKHPILGPALIIGDKRPYITALLSISLETANTLIKGQTFETAGEAIQHPVVQEAVHQAVLAANEHLARYEKIRRYRLLTRELSIESGDLTATLKLKRKHVLAKFPDETASLYEASPASEVIEAVPKRQ